MVNKISEIRDKLQTATSGKHLGHHCPSCDTEDCPRCTAKWEIQGNAVETTTLLLTNLLELQTLIEQYLSWLTDAYLDREDETRIGTYPRNQEDPAYHINRRTFLDQANGYRNAAEYLRRLLGRCSCSTTTGNHSKICAEHLKEEA